MDRAVEGSDQSHSLQPLSLRLIISTALIPVASIIVAIVLARNASSGTGWLIGAMLAVQAIALTVAWRAHLTQQRRLWRAQKRAAELEGQERREEQLHSEIVEYAAQTAHLSRLVATLTAPLIPVDDRTVIVPLVGALDQDRVQNIRTNLLPGIERQRARVALVDLTGTVEIAPQATETLAQLITAVQLMGCRVILTGLNPVTAQAFLAQGIELPAETRRDVQDGLSYAAQLLAQSGIPGPTAEHDAALT